ncbi:uncharacterized protein LOC126851995 isoform X2 [Cataglyphis hispanica]|uniref:uncharacterized protein LOC126851995 isoform X2 n=1 Tax=Cataglyphis hispanica TaxID=1086592 RepID=UPI00218013C3|nr:uncharacterized protein LOC126851995 isoform X2 [Cataglyphis hispanica]
MPTNDARRDEIRKILLSLLLARPGAIPIAVLDRDYYEAEGERIPWRKFGYADVTEFLKSMPEHFVIEWCNGGHYVRGIASEKTKHVSSLVSRQKSTSKKYIAPRIHRSFINRCIPQMQRQRVRIPAEQLSYLVTFVKNNPNGVYLRDALAMLQKQLPHVMLSLYDMREQLHELPHSLYLDCDMIYPANDVSREAKNYQQSSTLEPQKMPRSSAMETTCVGGDEGSDFLEDEDSEENSFVPVKYLNNNCPKKSKTSERLAASFTRNANNEQNAMFNHNDDVNVDEYFGATNNNNKPDTMTANYVDLSSLISDRTKSRLDQLVRKHPEGIWCADLPDKYLKEYNVHLNYTELGFTSVRDADKRPTVPDQEVSKSEPIEISPSSREQHNEHNAVRTQHDDDDNAPIPANVSPTITRTFVPDDVMNYNDSVDLILVTDLQRDRKHLEIYVVEVFNPSFFWVHLRKNKRRFEIFMNELHTFYEYNKDKYTIPKIALKKGLNCACIYENNWHRAIIKSVKPDFKVTVIFYDFGTLKTYAPEDVYYLHKQFSFLPAQALPCGLYNVKPCVGDRWKKSVTDSLIDKIEGTLLALTIMSVDPANNSMMVILSDVSEEEDVHINDWLINEKLAQCGKMGDTVDMASIMKYVVNNLNQLPSYCFAEESLMSDSCSKAISTEKIHNKVPLVSSKQIHLGCDSLEQHSMIPPPGFAALGKKPNLSSMSSKSFDDIYSFGNTSNVKTSYGNAEVTTNPFLSGQQFVNDNVISNDIAEQIFRPIWNENLQLFITLSQILCDMVKCSPLNRKIFENHMTIQYHLNKFLKNFEKTLISDNDQSTVSTSSTLLNPARETMLDKVGLAEKTPINSNAENFVNQELMGMSNLSLSNPFDVKPPQTHNMFSAYCSNGYTFATNWHQSDGFSPRVQVPSPLTPTSAHSMFMNCGPSSANVFFPNAGQGNENSSATKSIPPVIPINTGLSNNCNSSNFFNTVNSEMVFKETNPFKFSIVNDMQEKQTERMTNNYDTNSVSYLSVKNLHDHSSKMEAANIHAASIGSIAAEHVNVNSAENHTPRIIYEAGPIMYNKQKQTDANMKHNTGNSNFKNDCNVTLKKHCSNKELSSQSARHDSSHIDEDYVTRPSTDYTLQDSPSIINSEPNYHQQNSNNERTVFPQTWKQVEIAEHCITSQFRNGTPLQNHNEKPTLNKFVNFLSHKDWNCNNNKESVTQSMNGMVDLSYIFQWNDKEKPLDMYKNFWNNPSYNEKQKFTECKNGNSDFFFDTSFVFQKIDSIKNVTFIFHIEGEGWMLTHEFVEIFTNLKLCSRLIAMVEAMNIKAAFKEIQRSDHPVQFLQLDHYPLNVPRDSDKHIVSIHLISLQTAVSLLYKLKIVTREEIDNAFKKKEFLDGSVMLHMWMLIVIYRDLKQRIEECKLWNINA